MCCGEKKDLFSSTAKKSGTEMLAPPVWGHAEAPGQTALRFEQDDRFSLRSHHKDTTPGGRGGVGSFDQSERHLNRRAAHTTKRHTTSSTNNMQHIQHAYGYQAQNVFDLMCPRDDGSFKYVHRVLVVLVLLHAGIYIIRRQRQECFAIHVPHSYKSLGHEAVEVFRQLLCNHFGPPRLVCRIGQQRKVHFS